jgi:hypothetical protein
VCFRLQAVLALSSAASQQRAWLDIPVSGLITNSPRAAPLTGTATMKVVTWRWSGVTTYQMQDFLPRFFGYLAADPSATASKASSKEIVV